MSGSKRDSWVAAHFGVDPASYGNALSSAWSWTKDKAAGAGKAIGEFDDAHGQVLTRAAGAAQMVAGAGEALAGAAMAGVGGAATGTGVGAAPGIPAMIGGAALAVNGADNAQTGLRTLVSGKFQHTGIATAAGAGAHALGASDQTAERITGAMDLAQGLAGGGASIASKVASKGAKGLSAAAKAEQAAMEAAKLEQAAAAAGKAEQAAAEAAKLAEAAKTAEAAKAAEAAATAAHVPQSLELADALSKAPKGSPERAKLIEDFAKQSTHVKPPPDRVVLGKWEPPGKGGYIDSAKDAGGIWYETPEGSYPMIGGATAWETNVAFLTQQLEKGVPKLEFANLKIDQALAEEAARVAKGLPGNPPARVKEILFLEENAPKYGYTRVGDSFVKAK